MPQVKVAITGSLSMPREEAIRLIEGKTNAAYSKSASWDTSYLVATRTDAGKAASAAKRGIMVIDEHQMIEFIECGEFPQYSVILWLRSAPRRILTFPRSSGLNTNRLSSPTSSAIVITWTLSPSAPSDACALEKLAMAPSISEAMMPKASRFSAPTAFSTLKSLRANNPRPSHRPTLRSGEAWWTF
jgi:hypothetical protein